VLLVFIAVCSACGGGGGHSGDAAHGGDGAQQDGSGAGAPLTADQIEKACIAAYSCDFAGSASKCGNDLSDGDTLVSEFRPDQIRCLAAAGSSCATALACIGLALSAPCGPEGTTCMGTVEHTCQNATAFDTQCAGGLWFTPDSTCVTTNTGHGCGLTTCTSGASCDGARAHDCANGIDQVVDCAVYGMTCASNGTLASCVGTGAACTGQRCDGSTWVRCQGGREQRVDCAAQLEGGTCVTASDGALFCGYANECSNATASTCNSNVLSFCVLGKQMTFDCSAAGYAGCSGGNCVSLQP